MKSINHKTLIDFLSTRSDGNSKSQYEELLGVINVPESYTKIGTLKDDRLRPAFYSYKLWTHYAIGFYPFNDCDIFRDQDDRILLSYVEYSGHAPFRRSFIASKNSPFIHQPVGFRLQINEQNHASFLDQLAGWGLDQLLIVEQLKTYANIRTLSDELPANALRIINRKAGHEGTTVYTIIAPRTKAVTLTNRFDTKENL